jgi:hypothetical protein
MEHAKSLKPSSLLNAYLLITLLFDAATLRTFWLSQFNLSVLSLFTASFVVKLALVVLEAAPKRRFFKQEYSGASPEEYSGIYGQSFLWWLNDLIARGGRQLLKPTDLYPMTKDMSSEELNDTFWKAWNNCKR